MLDIKPIKEEDLEMVNGGVGVQIVADGPWNKTVMNKENNKNKPDAVRGLNWNSVTMKP